MRNGEIVTMESEKQQSVRQELEDRIQAMSAACNAPEIGSFLEHGAEAILCYDLVCPLLHEGNEDIRLIVEASRSELLDGYVEAIARREKIGYMLLRGFFEGNFTALLYRQQGMSLYLWSRGAGFHMAHQLFEDKHEFWKYYRILFDDERFKRQYPGSSVTYKKIMSEASDIYDFLSTYIHKKSPGLGVGSGFSFQESVERIFRLLLTFIEREADFPDGVRFPSPLTYPSFLKGDKK